MAFYWLTPLGDSFVNSDWLEFVIHFQTNEQGGEQSAFMVNLSENSVWQRGFRQVCATLGTETFQEERKKAIYMFFEVNGLHLVTD